jgi:hypothetical protein
MLAMLERYDYCFMFEVDENETVFGKLRIKISAPRPKILTESFRGLPQFHSEIPKQYLRLAKTAFLHVSVPDCLFAEHSI